MMLIVSVIILCGYLPSVYLLKFLFTLLPIFYFYIFLLLSLESSFKVVLAVLGLLQICVNPGTSKFLQVGVNST